MPGSAFGAELGQARREAFTLFSRSELEFKCSINGDCQDGNSGVLRLNPHDLPVVTTKRENGVYPDEVKGASRSARLSFPASGYHVTGGCGLDGRL